MLGTRPLAPAPAGSGLRPVPGDAGPPLIGYTVQMMRRPIEFTRARCERYGPVSWLTALGTRMVTVAGPEATGTVLQNRDKAFASGPAWSYFIGPFFRRGIMLLDFDEHRRHRRILQQAFTPARLAGYLDRMNPAIAAGLSRWLSDQRATGERPSGQRTTGQRASDQARFGGRLRLYPAVKQLTLDLATDIFMGGQLGAGADRVNRAFVDCVRAGTAYVRFPVPGLRWSRGLAGRRTLEKFLHDQLPAKRAGAGEDLFSVLCHASDDGHRFTDEDVVNHMIFLLMVAHDTSTITLTAMGCHLATHPDWQERCREESLAVGDGPLRYEDLDRLTSLDLVMRESLRLVTPVPSLPRRAVRDTAVLDYFIPAGTLVAVSPHFTHHMPEHWPDPERFDPERFAEHRREDRSHRHAWEPFGAGAHKCIGMHFAGAQVKAVMHQLLLRFRWSVADGYAAPWDFTSLPRPKDGLPVDLSLA